MGKLRSIRFNNERFGEKTDTASIGLGIAAVIFGLIPGGQGFAALLGAAAAATGGASGISSTVSSRAAMKAGTKGGKADFAMSLSETLLSGLTLGGSTLIGSTASSAVTRLGLGITKLGALAGTAGGAYGVGHTIYQLADHKISAKGNVENLFNTFAGAALMAGTIGSALTGPDRDAPNVLSENAPKIKKPLLDSEDDTGYGTVYRQTLAGPFGGKYNQGLAMRTQFNPFTIGDDLSIGYKNDYDQNIMNVKDIFDNYDSAVAEDEHGEMTLNYLNSKKQFGTSISQIALKNVGIFNAAMAGTMLPYQQSSSSASTSSSSAGTTSTNTTSNTTSTSTTSNVYAQTTSSIANFPIGISSVMR